MDETERERTFTTEEVERLLLAAGATDHRRRKPPRTKRPRREKKKREQPKKETPPAKKRPRKAPRRQRTKKISPGIRHRTTWIFWLLLIGSVSFGIYKNFTAIDRHTIHERQVVTTKVSDTNGINNFIIDFARVYYSWNPDHASLDKRQASLKQYLTDSLIQLDNDSLRADVPTSSSVADVKVWSVKKTASDQYRVSFSVVQNIHNGMKKTNTSTTGTYSVSVYKTNTGDMVVTKNPTIAAAPSKASYKDTTEQSDGSVDSATAASATKFLETFFKLYPTSSERELSYYVTGGTKPINHNYTFDSLINPVFKRSGESIQVTLTVKYLDTTTAMTQLSQYTLKLTQKGDNWIIDGGI